jgi:hypothetical protein
MDWATFWALFNYLIWSGWSDWSNFHLFRDFLGGSSYKNDKSSPNFILLFNIFGKKWIGLHFGHFLTISSGHTEQFQSYRSSLLAVLATDSEPLRRNRTILQFYASEKNFPALSVKFSFPIFL